jgi:hypothetical protein
MTQTADDASLEFHIGLEAAIRTETDDLIRDDGLDPGLGPLTMVMTAGFLAIHNNLSEHFANCSDRLVKYRPTIAQTVKEKRPSDPLLTDLKTCQRLGCLLLPMIDRRCREAGYGPQFAIGALLTAAVDAAAELGQLNPFYDKLHSITNGMRSLRDHSGKPN